MRFLSRVVFVVLLSTGALTLHGCGKSKNKKTDDNDAEPATVTVSEPDPTEVSSGISGTPAAIPSEDIKPAGDVPVSSGGALSSPTLSSSIGEPEPAGAKPTVVSSPAGAKPTVVSSPAGAKPAGGDLVPGAPSSASSTPTSGSKPAAAAGVRLRGSSPAPVPKPAPAPKPKPSPTAGNAPAPPGGEFERLVVDDDDDDAPIDPNDNILRLNEKISVDEFKAMFNFFPLLNADMFPSGSTIMNVDSDGNCLFRAVSAALTGNPRGHSQLRVEITFNNSGLLKDAIRYIISHHDFIHFTGDLEDAWRQYFTLQIADSAGSAFMTIDEYVVYMQGKKKWGGEVELEALSMYLQRNIITIDSMNHQVTYPKQGRQAGWPASDPIRLILARNHYVAVMPPGS